MEQSEMLQFLQQVAQQKVSPEEALVKLKNTGFTELEYAKIDTERTVRTGGYPEVIYGAGKTAAQIVGIVQAMKQQKQPILLLG